MFTKQKESCLSPLCAMLLGMAVTVGFGFLMLSKCGKLPMMAGDKHCRCEGDGQGT